MNKNIAVDTNILIYALDIAYPKKKEISENLIDSIPIICPQNISEFANVCSRKFKFEKSTTFKIINSLLQKCILANFTVETLNTSENLSHKYDFQFFDAIIVASALINNCEVLYSEDMQNGIIIEKQLKIVNPFL